ncbi:MAG: glycosyltransferase [Xanthomonadaceae bacterium]|nr:glycosyltransferase [Rhodospirillaceae bacterium]NIA17830.1 glycosyltransferase [Xanthomonadaceae bacterium]
MRKTLLFTIDFPPNFGGVANYYRKICEYLPSDKIIVLTIKDIKAEDGEQSYKIYRKNLLTKLVIWPKWLPCFWYLYRIIKKEKIKTVLVGQVLPLGTVVMVLAKIMNFDYLVLTHSFDILVAQKSKRKKYLLKKILKNAKYITSNSDFTKQELIKLGIKENKITTIYPCPYFKPPADKKTKNDLIKRYNLKNKKIIFTVGRMVERKGADMVIKSIPKIKKEIANIVYIIAGGDASYKKKLRELSEKFSVNDKVIFMPNAKDEEIKALYDLGDLFIMPCRQMNEDVEGFGIVFLEANFFNKPVIGGKSGGAIEAIVNNKTGLLVNPLNLNEISRAVIKLLKDKNLAEKLGANGRQRVEQEFNWKKQTGKLKKLLE